MPEYAFPRSDEPFDFRHQAALYGRWRRDYSAMLYDAIEARAGAGGGRRAVDLCCGTGFVATALGARGWRPLGVDFSAPMLAEARAASRGRLALVRARGEALPVRDAGAALLTCGTGFHWLAPATALPEIARVLCPGGWAAVFWRYATADEPSTRFIIEVFARFGIAVPEAMFLPSHPAEPFAGSKLVSATPLRFEVDLDFTAESFHGVAATFEWIRRLAGSHHAAILAALRDEFERHFPGGLRERNTEYLYLARKP
jgi:SAM-dependent methyltransferase